MRYRLTVTQHDCTWTFGTDGWKQVRGHNDGFEIVFESYEEALLACNEQLALGYRPIGIQPLQEA